MQTTKDNGTQYIALVIVVLAVALAMFAFAMGRNDPTTRTIVLTTITGLVTGLLGLGAGLLNGGGGRPQSQNHEPATTFRPTTSTTNQEQGERP